MMKRLFVFLAGVLLAWPASAGQVPNPVNADTTLVSGHFVVGNTIQGVRDSGFATVPCSWMPSMTGDVTTPGASCSTTITGIAGATSIIRSTSTNPQYTIDTAAGMSRSFAFRTGALNRFQLRTNNATETGSNAGSNFELRVYNDAGSFVGDAFSVNRATMLMSIASLDPSSLPNPSASKGGVMAGDCASHQFARGINTGAGLDCAQPAFSDLSGLIAPSQIPPAGPGGLLGGVSQAICPVHRVANQIDGTGSVGCVQLDAVDITSLGSAATKNIGTSGAVVPLLNAANQWSAAQVFTAGSFSAPGAAVGTAADSGMYQDGADDPCFTSAGKIRLCLFNVSGAGAVFSATGANMMQASIGGSTAGVESIGNGATFGDFRALYTSNGGMGSHLALAHTRATSAGSFSALLSGDVLGEIDFAGDDGASDNTIGAAFKVVAKANWTTGNGQSDALLNLMNSAGALKNVLCADADTGLWLAQTGTGASCGTGANFLDMANNGSFASLRVAGDYHVAGSAPGVSGCGISPLVRSGSTDTAGEVFEGASATGCTITFAASKAIAPFCTMSTQTQLAAFSYSVSSVSLTATHSSATGGVLDYHCFQHG